MKIIPKEVVSTLKLVPLGNGRKYSPIIQAVLKLEPGEALQFSKEEWKLKSDPGAMIRIICNRHKLIVSTRALADKSGWVTIRKK